MNTETVLSESVAAAVNSIEFIDIFSIDEIQELQDLFSDANGVSSIITHPDGTPITKPSKVTRLCYGIIHKTEKGLLNCIKSDALLGRQNPDGPLVQPCLSGGLWDAGASISVGGRHIANWLIGQIRNEEVDTQRMIRYADEIGADRKEFLEALNEVPVMSGEQFNKVAKMLFAFANQLSEKAFSNLQLKIQMAEHKHSDDALRASEERYRSFLSQVSEGVYRLEGDQPLDMSLPIEEQVDFIYDHFFIVECNNSFVKMYGASDQKEVLGKGHLDFHGGRNNPVNRGLLKDFILNGYRVENGITEESDSTGKKIFITNNSLGIIENNYLVRIWGTQIEVTDRINADRELKESREQYKLLTESIIDVVFVLDVESMTFLYISPSVERLRGYSPLEVMSESAVKALVPENIDKIIAITHGRAYDFLSGKAPFDKYYTDELRQSRKDGSFIWTEIITSYYLNPERGKVEQRGVIRDISERKQAEETSRTNKILLEQTFEQSPIPMVLVSMPDAVIRIANPACVDFLGMTDEPSVLNRPLLGINFSWRDFNVEGIEEGVFDLPLAKSLRGIKTIGEERYLVLKDGRIKNELVFGSPIFDDSGNLIAGYLVMLDITNRKLDEKKLRESEEKLSTLFTAMTEMVVLHEVVFNTDGEAVNYRIIDCNDAYTKITGIKKEDAIGSLATDVYQSEAAPYLEEYSKVGITGKSYEYNTYYAPMDKHFLISVVSPKKNHFATITSDITPIRQIQEIVSAKNKELENYLYVASHDLRSPLVNVQGFSQRLQKHTDSVKLILSGMNLEPEIRSSLDKITNDDIPKTINFIFSNVKKMDNLINGLLQISRTGRIRMTILKVDMNQLFKTIITSLNFQITELSAKVIFGDLPYCYGDENQLNQLFSNIIGNSLKYHDKNRQLVVEISGQAKFNKVLYTIKDSGIGIAPRHLEKIWDIFYRVDSTSGETGDGIGLSIAKRIAEKHRGKIWVESTEGTGSTFFIELQKNSFSEAPL